MIYSYFHFKELIYKYTRVAVTTNEQNEQKTTKTLIDHFSTTSPRYILRADVLRIGMVDHYMVYGVRKIDAWTLKKKQPKIIETCSLSRYDKELFRNVLRRIDWPAILDPLSEIVGDTWYSPYCLLAEYSTQLDRQSATGTMNACASANDSRRVFAQNHSSWEGQMWRMVPRSKSSKILQNL